MNIDYVKAKLIIENPEYKKIFLNIYKIDSYDYIKKDNLIIFYNMLYKYRLLDTNKVSNYEILEENIIFNNRPYKLINTSKLNRFIKIIQNNIIKSNTIIYLFKNIKINTIYPRLIKENKKILDEINNLRLEIKELKKLSQEIKDIRLIINYINTKINKIEKNYNLANINNNQSDNMSKSISYSLFFPNMLNNE